MKSLQESFKATKASIKVADFNATIKKARLAVDGDINIIEGKISSKKASLVDAESMAEKIVLQMPYALKNHKRCVSFIHMTNRRLNTHCQKCFYSTDAK